MKKGFIVLMLLLAAAIIFAAGGSQAPGAVSRPAGMTASGYPIITDGSVTMKYWTPIGGGASRFIQSYAENSAYQEIEKRTGIKIDWVHPATGMEQEQFNLMMASGDIPDMVTNANFYRGGEFQGMYDGIFLELTDLVFQYAPDYAKFIRDDEEFFREVSDNDGRICAFYCYKPYGDPPANRIVMRKDVLDELKMNIPRTIADYDNLFAGMLSLGIVPLLPERNGLPRQWVGVYDIAPYLCKDANGRIMYGQAQPGFRQYLEMMNRWYAAGYISKDFTGITANQGNTLFDTKQIGVQIGAVAANFNRGEAMGFEVVSAPYPRLRLGQQLHHEQADIWPLNGRGVQMAVISAKTRYPEAAVRWQNYAFSTVGAELYNWGVEGIAYNVVNGQKIYTDLVFENPRFSTDDATYIHKIHFAPKWMEFGVVCNPNLLRSPASLAIRMLYGDDPNVDSSLSIPLYSLTIEETNLRTRVLSEIDTYTDEMTLKFITGAEPLSRWDAYVQQINNMGLPNLLRSEQAAYERYLGKKLK